MLLYDDCVVLELVLVDIEVMLVGGIFIFGEVVVDCYVFCMMLYEWLCCYLGYCGWFGVCVIGFVCDVVGVVCGVCSVDGEVFVDVVVLVVGL